MAVALAAAATPLRAETIRLEGAIDAARLHEIAMSASGLETLDLSDAVIEAYEGPRLAANRTVHPAATLPAYALSGLKARKVILPSTVTAIGDGALMGAEIEELTIPASVTEIGRGAFAACRRLRSATLPATVRSIGSHIFSGCTALTRVRMMSGDVPASAFAGCTALADVTLAEGIAAIGDDAFAGCASLQSVTIPASARRIGSRAFSRSGITRADLTACSTLASVGDEAFAHCPSLTSVSLPASASEMGQGVFFGSGALRSVTLPATLTTLPPLTFKGAVGIYDASALLHEGIDSIGTLAMAGMSGASSVTLPSTLRYIDDGAFEGWSSMSLTDATPLRHLPELGQGVWDGVEQSKVFLDTDPSVTDLFMAAPQWCEFSFDRSGTTQTADAVSRPSLRVRFDGDMLCIEASGPIASVTLHNLGGIAVATADAGGDTSVTLDTSHTRAQFFILSVTLADRSRATIKLIRQ